MKPGGVSFYLVSKKRLFILGGINGDTDYRDTDHFDSSIILHEYGHFLESQFAVSNSPGGPHYGHTLIDPRLALSEGWGNFFQAAVQYALSDAPKYIDTVGNEDGATDFFVNINLETPDPICNIYPEVPGCDQPQLPHEGNFREFAITRFLWDTVDTSNDNGTDSITRGFTELWASLTSGNGYHNPHAHFRSIGFMHQIQSSLTHNDTTPITDWDPLRNLNQHRQRGDRREYALYVDDTEVCESMNFNMDPFDFLGNENGFKTSHLLRNNDFLHLDHSTDGDLTLELNYKTNEGTEADLDLYLYNSWARFGFEDDLIDYSRNAPSTDSSGNTESETLTLKNLPAGDYLINVNLYVDKAERPDIGDETIFEILANGVRLCPANLPEATE